MHKKAACAYQKLFWYKYDQVIAGSFPMKFFSSKILRANWIEDVKVLHTLTPYITHF